MDATNMPYLPTMEEKLAAVGRRIDNSIYEAKLVKKQLSHRRYGIIVVVVIVIICTFVSLIYIKPTKEADYAGVATLISVLWLIPSVMFYVYHQKKCIKAIDSVIDQSEKPVTPEPITTIEQTTTLEPSSPTKILAFNQNDLSNGFAALKKTTPSPRRQSNSFEQQLKQALSQSSNTRQVPEYTPKQFVKQVSPLEQQMVEKVNQRGERSAMGDEDFSV